MTRQKFYFQYLKTTHFCLLTFSPMLVFSTNKMMADPEFVGQKTNEGKKARGYPIIRTRLEPRPMEVRCIILVLSDVSHLTENAKYYYSRSVRWKHLTPQKYWMSRVPAAQDSGQMETITEQFQ